MTTRLFFILIAAVLFHSSPSSAVTKLTNVFGASNFDIVKTPYQIFGGTAGDSTLCTGSGFDTCDSCEPGLFACNRNRIYNARRIRIEFSSDSITDGTSYRTAIRVITNGGTAQEINNVITSPVNGKNQVGSVEMYWEDLCYAVGTANSVPLVNGCDDVPINGSVTVGFVDANVPSGNFADSIEAKLRVYTPNPNLDIDRDFTDDCDAAAASSPAQQGICKYSLFPGDEKAYVETLTPTGSFPSSGILKVKYLRFLYSPTGFNDITAKSDFVDIELNTTDTSGGFGEVNTLNNRLSGLTNDQVYYTRIATVDEAGNMADFTSDVAIAYYCPVEDVLSCPLMVQPSQVLGLLPKNFNCFITSAAYGSPMEKHVQLFTKFRGDILMKSDLGRAISRVYYKYGPYPAVFLMNNPSFKPLARAILWPAWGVAWISLNIGIWAGLIVSFLPLIAGISIFRISRKKSHAEQTISI